MMWPSLIVPAVWTTLETTLETRAWALVRYRNGGGWADDLGLRPADLAQGYMAPGTTGGAGYGTPQINCTEAYSMRTDASGFLQMRSNAGAITGDFVGMMAAEDGTDWTHIDNVIFGTPFSAPPVAWTDLDTGVGRRTVVQLRLRRQNAGAFINRRYAFRPRGDAGSYLLAAGNPGGVSHVEIDRGGGALPEGIALVEVETDASGYVQWIASANTENVEVVCVGAFNQPPAFSSTAVGAPVAPNTAIVPYFTVRDPNAADDSIPSASIDLDLTAPDGTVHNVIIGGAWQAPWNGTIAASGNGWHVVVTTHDPYMIGEWTATARADDQIGETTEFSWTFVVAWDAPTLTITEPEGPTDELTRIMCRAESDTYGFDMATVRMTIRDCITRDSDAYVAVDGGVVQPGFGGIVLTDGAANPLRFDLVLRSWPDAIETRLPPRLWTFEVTGTTTVGAEL